MTTAAPKPFVTRLAGQSALLTSGLALSQLFALGRNSVLGYLLSKGDFGIAASMTLALQVLEIASDTAADRLIIQDRDGDNACVVNAAHAILFMRGILMAVVLYAGAPAIARLFHVDFAEHTFRLLAIVPVIKSLVHLDSKRLQRHYKNRATVLIEVIPQALSFILAYPVAKVYGDYSAVVWLAIVQATIATMVSHYTAERPWGFETDRDTLVRFLKFGWPVLLTALPMIAINQFDRIVIGRYFGMEDLAAYTAAFMITAAPGTVLVKVGSSMMLPLLAEFQDNQRRFTLRFSFLAEAAVLAACLYFAVFCIAGGAIVHLAFGKNYAGLEVLTAVLASAWAVRILALASGQALMAKGDTKSGLVAVTIRALSLYLTLYAAFSGYGLLGIAASGIAGDALSIAYLTWRTETTGRGHAALLAQRSLLLLPVALASSLTAEAVAGRPVLAVFALLLLTASIAAAAIAMLPGLRAAFTANQPLIRSKVSAFRAALAVTE